jgi:hypothetical protein
MSESFNILQLEEKISKNIRNTLSTLQGRTIELTKLMHKKLEVMGGKNDSMLQI